MNGNKLDRSYKNLLAWQYSMDLVKQVFLVTKSFPEDEKFTLSYQLKKSAISIPSNITEVSGRNSQKEFINFLSYAHGSLNELETQLLIAESLNYCSSTSLDEIYNLCAKTGKLINGLMNSLKRGKFKIEEAISEYD